MRPRDRLRGSTREKCAPIPVTSHPPALRLAAFPVRFPLEPLLPVRHAGALVTHFTHLFTMLSLTIKPSFSRPLRPGLLAVAAVIAAVIAAAPHAGAQAPAETRADLPPITVVGEARDLDSPSLTVPSIAETERRMQSIPGGVSLIDAEDYRRGRATTLKDALEFAPGVFVQPRFGSEEARLSVRGSGLQRTFHGRGLKLLQDGVPLNLADGGFDFQSIEPLATRHIEVYRGANALELGAGTLGGAINFVSFTGHDAPPVGLRAEYGSFNSFRGQLSSGAVFGPSDIYASLTHSSTDGFRDHGRQSHQRLFANLGHRFSDQLETRLYLTYVHADSQLPGDLTWQQLRHTPRQARRNAEMPMFDNVLSNWKRDFDLFRLASRTVWDNGDHRLTFSAAWSWKELDHPILFVIDQVSHDFNLGVRYDNLLPVFGRRNEFAVGFQPGYGRTVDRRFDNNLGTRGFQFAENVQQSVNLDWFVNNRHFVTDDVSLVLGAVVSYARRDNDDRLADRLDRPDSSDVQDWWGFSPRLGVLWDVTGSSQLFANVSRSFEAPSFGELTAPEVGGSGLVDLDAQTATTVEIGTRGQTGGVRWDIAYYHAWLDNELLALTVAPGLTQTVNAGRTIHQGVEAGVEVPLGTELLVLRQSYLWNDFRFRNDSEFGNNRLPGVPEHMLRTELMFEHPSGFYLGPNLEWVPVSQGVDLAGSLFSQSYALLGFKIGYRSERGVSFFVEGKNLTDERYAATTGVINRATPFNQSQFLPGDGRGFYGGIEFRW